MRESQDIFYHLSLGYYKSAWFWFKTLIPFTTYYKNNNKLTRKDTWYGFKRTIICNLFGHKHYVIEYQERLELRCKRCGKWIKDLTQEEIIQYKREQKLKRIIK